MLYTYGSEIKKCCFTGYRPSKFPFKLDEKNCSLKKLENDLVNTLSELVKNGCNTFYTGMAMGFDIIAAECVLFIKSIYNSNGVKLIAVLPYMQQCDGYGNIWRTRYNSVLRRCDEVIVTAAEYYGGCFFLRNRFMVDNSDCIITWFNGMPGGTKNTIDYAERNLRQVINLNSFTLLEDLYKAE